MKDWISVTIHWKDGNISTLWLQSMGVAIQIRDIYEGKEFVEKCVLKTDKEEK